MTAAAGDGDARFFALRHAGQEATDFHLPDEAVRRFVELHDAGEPPDAIAAKLGVERRVVDELMRADAARAIAHRIATGELPMYPAPAPEERVHDARLGSERVPLLVVLAVLAGVVVVYLVGR